MLRRPKRWPRIAATAVLVAIAASGTNLLYQRHLAHLAHVLQLSDRTEVFYRGDTVVQPKDHFPQPRELSIDGDALVRAPETGTPLIVHTRLMVLKTSGRALFRVTAHWSESGEQVEVLSGHVQASKSYPSSYVVPDELSDGEMSMVNKTVDLMEKEHTDVLALRAWSDTLMQESAGRR